MRLVSKPDMSSLLELDWDSDYGFEILWVDEDMFSVGCTDEFQNVLEDMWLLLDRLPDMSGGGYEIN